MSQSKRLLALLSDQQWHSTVEIMERVYGGSHLGIARIGARVFDLRAKGHQIEGKKHPENPAIYLYRLVPEEPETIPLDLPLEEQRKAAVSAMAEQQRVSPSSIHVCMADDMHPYNCDGMFGGRCIHCEGTVEEGHDPVTCALCNWDSELDAV